MQVPKIEKICLNQGLGKAIADRKIVDGAMEELGPNLRSEGSGDRFYQGRLELQAA